MIKESVIKEFLSNNSDDEIRYLGMRLTERLQDDLAEVFNFIGKSSARNVAIDEMFGSTTTANELYDCCDAFQDLLCEDAARRKVSLVRVKPNGERR